jgi:hypothetical protein
MKCLYVSSPLSGQLFNIQHPPVGTVDSATWPPRAPINYFALSVNVTDRVSRGEAAHHAFHRSLVAACGSSWLLDMDGHLFDAADRYRHLARRSALTGTPARPD